MLSHLGTDSGAIYVKDRRFIETLNGPFFWTENELSFQTSFTRLLSFLDCTSINDAWAIAVAPRSSESILQLPLAFKICLHTDAQSIKITKVHGKVATMQ